MIPRRAAFGQGWILGGLPTVNQGVTAHGKDLRIGADILRRAALDEELSGATGRYCDNDAGCFGQPDPSARNRIHIAELMATIAELAQRSA